MKISKLEKNREKGQRVILLAFLILHVVASYYYISHQNITYDEPQYLEYAKRWLQGKPERIQPLDDSKSPVVAICWLPRIVRQLSNPNYHLTDYGRKDQEEGRYMMIFFSLLTALYVYWWCRDFYGIKGWRLPLLLLLFDPLYLAYSSLITTDLACGTFLAAILYHYRKYIVLNSRKHFYLGAIFTAIGIITKQSLLFVSLLLPILSVVHFIITPGNKKFITKRIMLDIFLFAVIIIAVINGAYYFHKAFLPFGQYQFVSNTFSSLQNRLTFLRSIPVPLPQSYVQSLDLLKASAETGAGKPNSTYNGIYLFGQWKLTGHFWYYYVVTFLYKTPIGTLFLFSVSICLFIGKFNLKEFANKYQFLTIPIIFYWIILSFFNQFQTGIRHLLLIYPLLFIGLGYLFQYLLKAAKTYRVLIAMAIAYTFTSVSFYYPNLIPYTNEFITNKATVYKKIYDTSIDYGQSDSSLNTFTASNPDYKKASSIPDTGKFIVLMRQVMNNDPVNGNLYQWYRQLEPAGHYRYVLLTYDIKENDLVKAGFWRK